MVQGGHNNLVDVTPYTRRAPGRGPEAGLVHVMDASLAERWVEDHAAELVAQGFASVVIEPHRLGGRAWRWFGENAERLKEETRVR